MAEKKQTKDLTKQKKAEKPEKKFPAKKLPSLFKKSYTEKKFNKKILKKIYVPEDKKTVESMFKKGANPKKPECYAVSMDGLYTKKELKNYKLLAKQIKGQKGRVKFAPLIAVIVSVAALVIVVGMFKNPIAKKIIKSSCEGIFGAKTDVESVNIEIMSTSLTVNGICIGNKNSVMKNLFEAKKIAVDFNLVQALRGKFDAQNLEVSGMDFNTDRKTSCELPKKAKKEKAKSDEKSGNKFAESIKAKSTEAIENLKTQATDMLGGSDVDSIVANLESQLQTTKAAENAKTQITDLTAKWKDKPAELKTQVDDFSKSVSDLQSINVNNIKDVATLKATLEKINTAMTTGSKLKETTSTVTNDIKADAATVTGLGNSIKDAVQSDTDLAKQKLASVTSAVSNAKNLLTSGFDTIGYDILGKYYPYVKKAVNYGLQMKASSSKSSKKTKAVKSTKKEGKRRLQGTTFWYAKENPSVLIEHVLASGPDFSAEGTEITTDQDVRNKPMKLNGTYSGSGIDHEFDFILDARSESTEPLITLDYAGSGFTANIDGTKIAAQSGIPSVNGKAKIIMNATADSGLFTASGNVNLNPLALTSDGFENETVTKYYKQALDTVKNMSIGFDAGFSEANGVTLGLNGNFANQFAEALKTVVASIGTDAKDAALKKVQDEINSSSSDVMAQVKAFAGIQGDIDLQNTKVSDINKILDTKKAEIEEKIKSSATDAVKSKLGDTSSKAASDAASALKGKLKF
ncbi:MAG: TIGR03545 family protein [Treponema sp.]